MFFLSKHVEYCSCNLNTLPKVANRTGWIIFVAKSAVFFTKWSRLRFFSCRVIKYFWGAGN